MWGWNNLLPIGQNAQSIAGEVVVANRASRSRPCLEARQRSAHIGPPTPQELETSKLTTSPILISKLATARLLCFPTPSLVSTQRPHCHPGIIGGNDSQGQRQRHSPNASASGITLAQKKDGVGRMEYGFLGSLCFSSSLILLLIMMYWFSFVKLVSHIFSGNP